ncbi:MAG TPA: GNAT family N-acetyltransferase [Polyangiaceae bacterium]|nr:GNAT family N-acetyltransferase [Polyangiaceae bacterium]
MTLSFRPARAEDLDRLIAIHSAAYPDDRSHDARVRNFIDNPLGTLDDLWVAEECSILVGHAFLYRMRAWFGGAPVPVGGIASLAVAPESRRAGIATGLIAHLHDVARERGDALTVLYPFRRQFYGRLGYAATSPYRRLRFAPAAVAWKRELKARAAAGADRGAMIAAWDAAARAGTGALVRTERIWNLRLADERSTWLVVEGQEGVQGYAAWTVERPEPRGEPMLVVHELAAHSHRAARSLWAAVGTQRDQVAMVRVDVSEDDPMDRALLEGEPSCAGDPLQRPIGELMLGPMVRMVDLERALSARGWRASGRLVFETEEGAAELDVSGGIATVLKTGAEPDVRLDRITLAAVAFGGLRPSQAARLGWVTARDEAALALADTLLALPPYFSSERF